MFETFTVSVIQFSGKFRWFSKPASALNYVVDILDTFLNSLLHVSDIETTPCVNHLIDTLKLQSKGPL